MRYVQIAGPKPPRAAPQLRAKENPVVRISSGMISVRNTLLAPTYEPNKQENQSSTPRSRPKDGALTNQKRAGYAVSSVASVAPKSNGRLPIRSDNAPMTGSQTRFDTPTQRITVVVL